MANALKTADFKALVEMSKAELAIEFVSNAEKIATLKANLKKLEERNSQIEAILLPQIGLKYQPKDTDFILMPKLVKGRKSTSYASIVKDAPKACKLSDTQKAVFADLVSENTKFGEDKKTIQIIE